MSVATARAVETPTGAAAVERLMRPRSVAIVGISSKPGSAGHTALGNLTLNKYAGDIYLVGRSGGEVEGRKVLPDRRRSARRHRSRGLHDAGRWRARCIGGLRPAQGSRGGGVRLGLCGIRQSGSAGDARARSRAMAASRCSVRIVSATPISSTACRSDLPAQRRCRRRRHSRDPAARDHFAERRLHGASAPGVRGPQPADVLHGVARQRGRARSRRLRASFSQPTNRRRRSCSMPSISAVRWNFSPPRRRRARPASRSS